MADLTDDETAAAAWAVAHLIDKHGYSSIPIGSAARVDLAELLSKLTPEEES